MSRLQVDPSRVREIVLVREDRACPECGAKMHIRCCRTRETFIRSKVSVRLIVKLVQCRNGQCDNTSTFAPEQESDYAYASLGDRLGRLLLDRPTAVLQALGPCPQIRHELADSYDILLSDDAIEDHIASYQNMVAARHQDLREMEDALSRHGRRRSDNRRLAAREGTRDTLRSS